MIRLAARVSKPVRARDRVGRSGKEGGYPRLKAYAGAATIWCGQLGSNKRILVVNENTIMGNSVEGTVLKCRGSWGLLILGWTLYWVGKYVSLMRDSNRRGLGRKGITGSG